MGIRRYCNSFASRVEPNSKVLISGFSNADIISPIAAAAIAAMTSPGTQLGNTLTKVKNEMAPRGS